MWNQRWILQSTGLLLTGMMGSEWFLRSATHFSFILSHFWGCFLPQHWYWPLSPTICYTIPNPTQVSEGSARGSFPPAAGKPDTTAGWRWDQPGSLPVLRFLMTQAGINGVSLSLHILRLNHLFSVEQLHQKQQFCFLEDTVCRYSGLDYRQIKNSEQRLMWKSSWETDIKQWTFLLADYLKDVKLTFSSAQGQWNHNQWTILGRKSILNGIKDEGFTPRVISLEQWHPHLMTTTSLL